jgi:thiol-disulfide isomerase/thioredoxin
VNEQIDNKADVDDYLAKIRYENAEMVPNLSIIISDTIKISVHDFIGHNFMVVFFNPGCGSCRQELKNINQLFQQDDAQLKHIFILNQPQTIKQAYQLLSRYDYKNPTLAILSNLNAYDLIQSEPTTWIINKQGKIIYKHVGYQKGDEETYLNEIIEIKK